MSIKIIATDLDGTLMSTDHLTVTEYTRQTLFKAHEKGIKIAIATGRTMSLIESVIEQVPFVDYVIYSNGACVFDRNKNKVIYSNPIESKTAAEIVNYFLGKQVYFEIYIDGKAHFELGTDQYFVNGDFSKEFIDEIVRTNTGHEKLIEFLTDKPIEKYTMYSIFDDRFPIYMGKLRQIGLDVVSSFAGCIEATARGVSKGAALKGICEAEGYLPDEAMSFGDGGNDCSMLEYAGMSFAMENGSEECKKSAKKITKSNGDDGVAWAVEKYCLSSKLDANCL